MYPQAIRVFSEHGVTYATFDVRVERDWIAQLFLSLQDGQLVVSELRVRPRDAAARGIHARVPSGGITSRLLRQVPVHAHARAFAAMLRTPHGRSALEGILRGSPAEALLDARAPAPPPPPRTGRPPISIERLLPVAVAYAAALDAGSTQPVQDAATALGMSPLRVRDLVHRARSPSIGLLMKTIAGRGQGGLTPRGEALRKASTKATIRKASTKATIRKKARRTRR